MKWKNKEPRIDKLRKTKKIFIEIKGEEIEFVNIKEENKKANGNKEFNKVEVYDMKLHEVRNDVLKDHDGVLVMVGSMVVGKIFWRTMI